MTPTAADDVLDAALERHRADITRRNRVRNADQLVRLVDQLGFCFAFTPADGVPLPACFDHLSTNDTDRKWGWMWGWKDELAEEKRIYYGALLARKPTFVSMRLLPSFYASFGRAGEPDDHLEDARAGRLSDIARRIIDFLSQHGETQTKRMRAELGITSKDGRTQYGRAVDEVQRLMYVTRVRAVGEGRDDYNYTYDLFTRRYPEIVKAAERISSADAKITLLGRAIELAGALSPRQAVRIFDWEPAEVARAMARLEASGRARTRGSGSAALFVMPGYDAGVPRRAARLRSLGSLLAGRASR